MSVDSVGHNRGSVGADPRDGESSINRAGGIVHRQLATVERPLAAGGHTIDRNAGVGRGVALHPEDTWGHRGYLGSGPDNLRLH